MWDWLGGLGDWGSQLGADIIGFLQWMMQWMVAVLQYLYQLIAAVFQFLWNLLKMVGGFFKTLWEEVYKHVLVPLYNAILKVHSWLESKLAPIVSFLTKVRNFLNHWFLTYIKPILSMISTVRKFLELLRSFGIKWAGTLDKVLGQIQSDITKSFLKVQSYLNAVIGIVNALADPLGLFRRPTLLMSLRRIAPSLLRGVTGMPMGYYFPTPRKNPGAGLGPTPFPLNLSDPAQNPPPSAYFSGDDGLGSFGGFDTSIVPADDAGDGMSALDYFDDSLYPPPDNSDPVSALAALQSASYAGISGGN